MKTEKWPILYRLFDCEIRRIPAAVVEGADGERAVKADDAEEIYEFVASSEQPVERWFGDEVLSHARGAIDFAYLKRNAAMLVNHNPNLQVGAVKTFDVGEDRKMRLGTKWSRSAFAQEIRQDVDDEIRTQVSIGYRVQKAKRTRVADVEKGVRDEVTVTRWTPYEMSIVSVAADVAGTGASRGQTSDEKFDVDIEDGEAVGEARKMGEVEEKAAAEKAKVDAEAAATAARAATRRVEVGEEHGDAKEIVKLAKAYNRQDLIPAAIERGLSVREFKDELLDVLGTKGKPVGAREATVDVPEKDRKRFSYRAALVGACLLADGKAHRFKGLEREMHDELEAKLPQEFDRHGGVHVPMAMNPNTWDRIALQHMQRAYPLDSATTGEGKEGVFTAQGEFIELLRNRLVVAPMGARMLPGLVGPVTFPRQSAAGTFVWYTEEAAAIADSMLTLDTVALSPKTGMSSTGYTRQLLGQESIGIEVLVRDDLAKIHALGIDQACLIGSAAAGQPRGIALQSGVGVVDFGAGANANAAPAFSKLVDMEATIEDANAGGGAQGFVMTALTAGTCRKTLEFPTAPGGSPIWTGSFERGMVAGYRAMASNQAGKVWLNGAPTGGTEHGLFFANWNELMIGFWGSMEVVVDPYTLKKRAIIEVTTFQMLDCMVRHPASFVIGSNVIP